MKADTETGKITGEFKRKINVMQKIKGKIVELSKLIEKLRGAPKLETFPKK